MKLTPVQREILITLVDLYHRTKEAVKGEDIAEIIKKNPGTIRNQMQSLRSMGLVEGVPGPKGGYKPTAECYKVLNIEPCDQEEYVPFYINSVLADDIKVVGISLPDIPHPNLCRASVQVLGNTKKINVGDIIRIGPTPVNKLIIRGRVIGRDDIDNILLIDILEMISIPKEKVKDVATMNLKTLSPNVTVREAAKVISEENISGMPIVEGGKAVGIITTTDITRALAEGKEDTIVREIMSKEVYTINENAMLAEAIEKMENKKVGRLIVTNENNEIVGIITRTDIICRMARIFRDVKQPQFVTV